MGSVWKTCMQTEIISPDVRNYHRRCLEPIWCTLWFLVCLYCGCWPSHALVLKAEGELGRSYVDHTGRWRTLCPAPRDMFQSWHRSLTAGHLGYLVVTATAGVAGLKHISSWTLPLLMQYCTADLSFDNWMNKFYYCCYAIKTGHPKSKKKIPGW